MSFTQCYRLASRFCPERVHLLVDRRAHRCVLLPSVGFIAQFPAFACVLPSENFLPKCFAERFCRRAFTAKRSVMRFSLAEISSDRLTQTTQFALQFECAHPARGGRRRARMHGSNRPAMRGGQQDGENPRTIDSVRATAASNGDGTTVTRHLSRLAS